MRKRALQLLLTVLTLVSAGGAGCICGQPLFGNHRCGDSAQSELFEP